MNPSSRKLKEIDVQGRRGHHDPFAYFKPVRARSIFGAVLSLLIVQWGWGQTLDFSASPRANDSFLAASFRYRCLQDGLPSQAVLLFVPGTDGDGRDVVNNPEFVKIASTCHADIVGCYFRGEGRSYDDPVGGSGRALDEALAYFAAKTGRPELAQAALLPIGFSQGGMFVFNYVCWRPQHVRAFACLRAIFPRLKPEEASFQIPGLLAAGEYDQPGRIRAITKAFGEAEGHNSKWALLWERGSGHDLGQSIKLVNSLFEAVCRGGAGNSPYFTDTKAKEVTDSSCSRSNLNWFPNKNVAEIWKSLQQPVAFEDLLSLPDKPRLEDLISIRTTPDAFKCQNGDSKAGVLSITARDAKITDVQVKVTGDGFSLVSPSRGELPAEFKISFSPKNMDWGEARGQVVVTWPGQDVQPLNTTLYGMVVGILTPVPSTVYLGVTDPGGEVEKTILLKSSLAKVHLAEIRAPAGITVSVEPVNKNGDFQLRIRWVGGERLGRMLGQIELTVDAPQRGVLRIPILGFVTLTGSYFNKPKPAAYFAKVCSGSSVPFSLKHGRGA